MPRAKGFCMPKKWLLLLSTSKAKRCQVALFSLIYYLSPLSLVLNCLYFVRYSSQITLMALRWMKLSPKSYQTIILEGVLSLPSVSHLKRLSSGINLQTGLSSSTVSYLEKQFKALNDREKIVTLVIDEVIKDH